MSDDIKKEDLFNVIKHGHAWYEAKIEEEIKKVINKFPYDLTGHHDLRWDKDDEYHYIYDNECYLFIFKGEIELRSDRENVFSSNKTIKYSIKNEKDIEEAYRHFLSLTMEEEDE